MRYIHLLIVFNLCFLWPCIKGWAEPIIIVNKSVKEVSITTQDLKLVYLGKKIKWKDGQKIRPVRLLEGELHDSFVQEYVEKSSSSYLQYWWQAFTTGTGIPPKALKSEEHVVIWVSKTKGAIGYISQDTPHSGVTVLPIEPSRRSSLSR